MSDKTVRITRSDLYEQVWTTPMRKLAARYGLSDVGLAKTCERHQIPRPPVGYWAKKEVGKAPPRPALPALHTPGSDVIEIWIPAEPRAPQPRKHFDPEVVQLIEAERSQPPIVVPAALRNPHRLIASTREWEHVLAQHERRRKRHEFEYEPLPPRKDVLSIDVSSGEFGRAMRILDALLKAFEARRYVVRVAGEGHRESSQVTVLGELFEFRLRERLKRVAYTPTKDDLEMMRLAPSLATRRKWDLAHCGEFELHFQLVRGCGQRTWRDVDKSHLVTQLNEIPTWLLEQVDIQRETRAHEEQQRRFREERERQRREEEQRREKERRRAWRLIKDARAWEMSRRIHAYLDAARRVAAQAPAQIEDHASLQAWFEWAQGVADGMDPLKRRVSEA